jgi:hypothetical protein
VKKTNTTIKIILLAVGAFIAYTIIVVAYVESTTDQPVKKLVLFGKYAPWLMSFVG